MLTANVENMLVTSISRTLETGVVPTQYIVILSTVRRQSANGIQRWFNVFFFLVRRKNGKIF